MVIVSFAAETAQAVEECLPITLHEKKETVSPYSDLIQEKENMEGRKGRGKGEDVGGIHASPPLD